MVPLLLPTSEPSICIPRVFSNIDKTFVKNVFEELFGEGCIERIDMIQKTSGNSEKFQRVFVHFKYWPATQRNQQVRKRLIDGHQIKIVYSEPWFWKCSASRIPKPKDKAIYSFVNEVSETCDPVGKKDAKKGEKGEKREKWEKREKREKRETGWMRFDSMKDFGETEEATEDGDATGDGDGDRDATGDDDKIMETGWRQVNKKIRGKKNRRADNSGGRALREATR
jgi:hypothetical protein